MSIKCEVRNDTMWITLNKPERLNAMDREMRESLLKCLMDAEDNSGVRFVVIRGSGRAFSSGADVSMLKEWVEEDPMVVHRGLGKYGVSTIGAFIRSMSKPVIAMVHGYCFGGGFELVQYCDLVYASEDAVFGQTEINLGIIPGGGGTQLLPRLVGEKKAKELVFLGRRITAREAKELGIINDVYPSDKLEEGVMGIIDELRKKSSSALALAKQAINAIYDEPLSSGLRLERALYIEALKTRDGKEGIMAFLEKRQPRFE